MGKYRYAYNCVSPLDRDELFHIVDNYIDIKYETFRKHVDKEDFQELQKQLGYDKWLHIKNDWSVSFHRSKYKGKTIYFLCHSAIEYVFKEK